MGTTDDKGWQIAQSFVDEDACFIRLNDCLQLFALFLFLNWLQNCFFDRFAHLQLTRQDRKDWIHVLLVVLLFLVLLILLIVSQGDVAYLFIFDYCICNFRIGHFWYLSHSQQNRFEGMIVLIIDFPNEKIYLYLVLHTFLNLIQIDIRILRRIFINFFLSPLIRPFTLLLFPLFFKFSLLFSLLRLLFRYPFVWFHFVDFDLYKTHDQSFEFEDN